MRDRWKRELRDTGRSVIGALILGLPLIYTMETWWVAWRLPAWVLLLYDLAGMVVVLVVVRYVGFRPQEEEKKRRRSLLGVARDFLELVLHSALAALIVLALLGIVEPGMPLDEVLRQVAVQLVPLAFGASIADELLSSAGGRGSPSTPSMGKAAATGAAGALFFTFPIAITEEMEKIPAQMGWGRVTVLFAVGFILTYLVLFELEFRGRSGRLKGLNKPWLRWGAAGVAHVEALLVATFLLAGLGQFLDSTFEQAIQMVVVLGFLGNLGAAAARVVV